ncbi:hypothetical protein BCR44DRAFT_27713 [Catenaria anguillulae PL171]|uniref:G-patch domain-containing protein n=1 Tax=Catenaria anguillulae PL171 TaxID=765915 RepID=A0A1Y2HIZ3_9FUNG|nr:hypothetical protein BCR44DRAFT_27713 [Catenaria anguillulae PL171]
MDLSFILGTSGQSSWSDTGSSDVSDTPTPLLLLRDLDLAATSESIFSTLTDLAKALDKPDLIPIQARMIRSKTTHASLGFAFVEFSSVEAAQAVVAVLTDKSLYPSGFFILTKAATVAFGSVSAFVSAYATSQFTVVVPTPATEEEGQDGGAPPRIVAYHHSSAYAVGYPVPKLAPVRPITAVAAASDDPLAAFYADIGDDTSANPSAQASEPATHTPDPIPSYALIHIPAHEDFIDRRRRLCCLCRRVFPTTKAALKHSMHSPKHAAKLASDPLAQQVAMVLKYTYRHPPPPKKQPKTLETGIGGQLLAKLGWSGGGLGRSGEGITRAIEAVGYTPGAGVGAGIAVPAEMMAGTAGGAAGVDKALEITRKRYLG